LAHGADIEIKDRSGATPLCSACSTDEFNVGVVQELVSHGADWSYRTPGGNTPYNLARSSGHTGAMEYLEQHYLKNVAQIEGRLGLLLVLREAEYSIEEVEEEEEDTDDESNDERIVRTIKNVSIRLGSVEIDTFLSMLASIVSDDPDAICSQDQDRALPVHLACRTRAHVEVVKFLVAQDAVTLHLSDNTGALPIHAACAGGAPLEAIQHLVEVGGGAVTLCARDRDAALPLHLLCKSKPAVDAIKFLVSSYPRSVSSRNTELQWM